MGDCCTPRGYRRVFSEKSAAGAVARYRKKGLDRTSRRVADLLIAAGVEGATVLEVGGGVGTVQIELLRAGARRAVSVELTPTYETAALELLHEEGLEGRVERKVVDFVQVADEVERADIVVMNRVVCCYPEMAQLVRAAAGRTGGLLVMTFPKRMWWTRALLAAANFAFRVTRQEFQIFLHRPERIRAAAQLEGLTSQADRVGFFWEIAALDRLPAAAP